MDKTPACSKCDNRAFYGKGHEGMLPHKHFLISAVAAVPASLVLNPHEPLIHTVQWFLVSGVVSGIIDLDVYVLVLVRARKEERLRPYRNLFTIFRDFRGFKNAMTMTGALSHGMIAHLMFTPVIAAFFYIFLQEYLIPSLIGIITHLITDLPNLKLLKRDKP